MGIAVLWHLKEQFTKEWKFIHHLLPYYSTTPSEVENWIPATRRFLAFPRHGEVTNILVFGWTVFLLSLNRVLFLIRSYHFSSPCSRDNSPSLKEIRNGCQQQNDRKPPMPLRLLRPEPPTPPATLLPVSGNPSPPQPPPPIPTNPALSIPISSTTPSLPLSPPPSVVNSSEILVELERNNNSANARRKGGPSGGDSEPNLIDCLLVSPAVNTLSIQLPAQADRVLGCFALILKMLWVYTEIYHCYSVLM